MLNAILLKFLPVWAHPRFPLVANALRHEAGDLGTLDNRRDLRFAVGLINLFLLVGMLIFLLGWGSVFGYLLTVLGIMVVALVVIGIEFLLVRILVSIPAQTSRMIAGEMENGTWEILLSTPLPRYQVILSKFAALFWGAEPVLMPLVMLRGMIVLYVCVERGAFLEKGQSLGMMAARLGVGLLVAVMPLVELGGLGSINLGLAMLSGSNRNAVVMNWGAWGIWRGGMAVFFSLLMMGAGLQGLMIVVWVALFPQWLVMLFWVMADEGHLETLAMGVSVGYIGIPLLLGGLSLLGMVWRVGR